MPYEPMTEEAMRDIVSRIAAQYDVPDTAIYGRGRSRAVSDARAEICYELFQAGAAPSEIAKLLLKDPSSIAAAISRYKPKNLSKTQEM